MSYDEDMEEGIVVNQKEDLWLVEQRKVRRKEKDESR